MTKSDEPTLKLKTEKNFKESEILGDQMRKEYAELAVRLADAWSHTGVVMANDGVEIVAIDYSGIPWTVTMKFNSSRGLLEALIRPAWVARVPSDDQRDDNVQESDLFNAGMGNTTESNNRGDSVRKEVRPSDEQGETNDETS